MLAKSGCRCYDDATGTTGHATPESETQTKHGKSDKDIDLSEVRFYRDADGKCALDLRVDVGTLTDTEGRGGVETRPGAAARKLVLEGSYDLP